MGGGQANSFTMPVNQCAKQNAYLRHVVVWIVVCLTCCELVFRATCEAPQPILIRETKETKESQSVAQSSVASDKSTRMAMNRAAIEVKMKALAKDKLWIKLILKAARAEQERAEKRAAPTQLRSTWIQDPQEKGLQAMSMQYGIQKLQQTRHRKTFAANELRSVSKSSLQSAIPEQPGSHKHGP